MPITTRNFNAQAGEEAMRLRKHRTPTWIKDMDFDKDDRNRMEESGKVHYTNFISMEEMKSWSAKKRDKKLE